MIKDDNEIFPLSKFKKIKGSRHLMREKIIQILSAYEVSETPWTIIFEHIFFREFNFGEDEEKSDHLLKPDEIIEIEADTPIEWQDNETEYARFIVEEAIVLKPVIDELLVSVVANWEIERIALIDRLIIQLAVTELMKSPKLPVKVTINEAIELAKQYSTGKSSIFINGVLDQIITVLNKEQSILKEGKGLL